MFYQNTIQCVRAQFPTVEPCESAMTTGEAHLLWMCEKIESFDEDSLQYAFKAARWIGWVLAGVEQSSHAHWTNENSREIVRLDVKQGFDKPTYMRGSSFSNFARRTKHLIYCFNEYLKRVYS
ncbi:MAG: hypothetical protein RLZZ76_348 [Candidatus Parcubacteria bacterium]